MPTKIITAESAEHYKWGGPSDPDCDGWHLVESPTLSIIEELMPPGTSETRHSHRHAQQFFFVLEGELTMELEHHEFKLRIGDGLSIGPVSSIKP